MENKQTFIQRWFKKADKQLLMNQPVTWSTRIFPAAIFTIAFSLFIFLLGFIGKDDPRNDSSLGSLQTYLAIFSLLAFVFWMIFLLRFNVFKRFGNWKWFDTLKTYLSYFIIIFLITAWPQLPSLITGLRANKAFPTSVMVKDINKMNLLICQLERNSINTAFAVTTLVLNDSVRGSSQVLDSTTVTLLKYRVDKEELERQLLSEDSVRQVNDTTWLTFSCPNLNFIYPGYYTYNNFLGTYTSFELYRMVFRNPAPVDKPKVQKELFALFAKYSVFHEDHVPPFPTKLEQVRAMDDVYELVRLRGCLNNILERKSYLAHDALMSSFRIVYYFSLVLSLLVLVFRHTTRKVFFLSLLTILLLTILTGLFVATSGGESFQGWILFYCFIFGSVAFTIITSTERLSVSGIGLALTVLVTPFVPLLMTSLYFSRKRYQYFYNDEFVSRRVYLNTDYYYALSEVVGFMLLLLLMATLFHRGFKRWYSLPEN